MPTSKQWWQLSKFDVIWFSAVLVAIFWHDGAPQGFVDWTVNMAGACAGWLSVSWLHHWWRTR